MSKAMRREPDPAAGSSATIDGASPAASRLAAIVFGREADVDRTIGDFIASAQKEGARIAGLVQEYGDDGDRAVHDIRVRDLTSGAQLPIMQNLGREATGCRIDSAPSRRPPA